MILHHKFIEAAKENKDKIAIKDRMTGATVPYARALIGALILDWTFKEYPRNEHSRCQLSWNFTAWGSGSDFAANAPDATGQAGRSYRQRTAGSQTGRDGQAAGVNAQGRVR